MISILLALTLSQGYMGSPPGIGGGKVLASFPFATAGCFASGAGGVAITRATNATYVDGAGAVQTCTSNQFRVAADGLLVEPARTNYALASATHPKAAEPSGSLPIATQYVAWSDTTLSVVAGGATVTGLSCSSVAAGTLCPFAVTAAGSVVITTAAGGTHVQIENGPYRTSRIVTTAAAVQRNADAISATVPAVPSKWCVAVSAKPEEGRAWGGAGASSRLWSTYTSGGAIDYATLLADSLSLQVYDHSGGSRSTAGSIVGLTAGSSHRMTGCGSGADLQVFVDGIRSGTGITSGAGTGLTSWGSNIWIGTQGNGDAPFGGYLKNLKICAAKNAKECP